MNNNTIFQLKVKQIASNCNFELTWGNNQVIDVNLNYPLSLTTHYERWHRAYLNYYNRMRGRTLSSGAITISADTHTELVDAEAQLLHEFERWLLSPELVSIRREIASSISNTSPQQPVEIFLTCTPVELAKLPWESWDIVKEFGAQGKIRIARTAANIRNEAVIPIRRKARVLAIFGDDSNLNFDAEEKALKSVQSKLHIELIDCRQIYNGENVVELKTKVVQAILDTRGWDMLFFAGHSKESQRTGGELFIAPQIYLSIHEIEDALKQAKNRGLQFAIFNSCSGINIAESLINIGLNQTIVMREGIHNQVAQEFFLKFLVSLTEFKDVHTALLDANEYLRTEERRLAYPSGYLVPSLFRHPNAPLFKIENISIWKTIQKLAPTKSELARTAGLLFLCFLPPVQSLLLEPRFLVQAIYRKYTNQIPSLHQDLVVIKIDENSIQADSYKNKKQIKPIDYSYLADILKQVSKLGAKTIGIDYVLDDITQKNNIPQLRQSIIDSVNQGAWYVFATEEGETTRRKGVIKEIADLKWSLQGDISSLDWYIELPSHQSEPEDVYPLAYLLSLSSKLQQSLPLTLQLSLKNKSNFQTSIITYLNNTNIENPKINFFKQARLQSTTEFSNNLLLSQQWLQPLIDYSIPYDKTFETISACKLLQNCKGQGKRPETLKNKTVLIIPGGYKEAGLDKNHTDNFPAPLPVKFWRNWKNETIPGAEAHVYMTYHLQQQRLLIAVPDFILILFAALLAKTILLTLLHNQRRLTKYLICINIIYILISLQLYISAYILLPYFLPSALFWLNIKSTLKRPALI
jgi:CHASE2 domain-containing sensor protein